VFLVDRVVEVVALPELLVRVVVVVLELLDKEILVVLEEIIIVLTPIFKQAVVEDLVPLEGLVEHQLPALVEMDLPLLFLVLQ
jgi:hypothetical protein